MPTKFFHPRYWLVWLGLGLLWLITRLPWSSQMSIGSVIGKLLFHALPSRRRVSCINLKIAFPELDNQALIELNKKHYISLAQGLLDAAQSWWGNTKHLEKLTHIEGIEHIKSATAAGENVLLVGAHFTSLEVGGRIIAAHTPVDAVYRPHQNELLEFLVAKERNKHFRKTISKRNIRQMIKSIKEGHVSWYATDQNYRLKGSMLIPFFGVDAPTNPSTARIAKMTKATIIPIFTLRLLGNKKDKRKGYLLRILPPVKNFPSGDDYQDIVRLNQIIEEQIKQFPEQYLWSHERYKHYQNESRDENKDFYKDYLHQHPEVNCQ
jgi:KDO2-lipid IV(A) lauroyltransferase